MGKITGVSRQYFHRLLSKQIEKSVRSEDSTGKTEVVEETMDVTVENNLLDEITIETAENKHCVEKTLCVKIEDDIKNELIKWVCEHRPSRNSANAILKIMSAHFNVPTDLKQLMPFKQKALIRTVAPGTYLHFGMKNIICENENILKHYEELIMDIGIDGLPLFNS